MIIAVGSSNPIKVNAAKEAAYSFDPNIKIISTNVSSGVSQMPMNRGEIRKGARTRALNALKGNADIGVGMEGGIHQIEGQYYLTSSVYACTSTEGAWGGEILVKLPDSIVTLVVQKGMELGSAIDTLSGIQDTKRKGGAVAFLTGGRLTRMQVFRDATIMALAPLLRPT